MLIDFFLKLKSHKLPVSIKEYLTLLEAMDKDVIGPSVDEFYYLSRAALVKDEANYDKFDRAFAEFWQGRRDDPRHRAQIPLEWLLKQVELTLTEEEKKQIEALGGWDKLMETLQAAPRGAERPPPGRQQVDRHRRHLAVRRLRLQPRRHPHRPGQGAQPQRGQGLGPARVPQPRRFGGARHAQHQGRAAQACASSRAKARRTSSTWTTPSTSTASKAYLDIHMRPERRNAIKVLMLMDIGGTMDEHIKLAEELFSAAKTEFKHLEFYYFHNCLYDFVWKDNRRRHSERTRTWDLLHKYGHDYKVIFVGDATMSPYEILQPGGSVEYFNEEPGAEWIKRVTDVYPKCVWLNPEPEEIWHYRQSIAIVKELMNGRMYPTTLEGLERAMRVLAK